MDKIKIEEKYVLEYIKDMLNDCKSKSIDVENARYHHNTLYKDTPKILKEGLLSKCKQTKLENRELTEKERFLFMDDGHVNGLDFISLAVVGLTDLYRNESEYNPFSPKFVDILVSSEVKAFRSAYNYGNEFLAQDKVDNKNFRSIDIRLLNHIMQINNCNNKDEVALLINDYNYLSIISKAIIDNNLDIPLREMSNENITLDKEKVIKLPKIIIKK